MKVLSTLAVTSSLLIGSTPFLIADAANQGNGIVTLEGQIVDSACALDTGSAYQLIEMPPVPVGRLIRDGDSDPHPFSLRLVACTLTRPDPETPGEYLPDWQHVRVTFDGLTDREGRSFAAQGSSQGVALHITDMQGRESVPGVPMPMAPISADDLSLHYIVQLVGNNQPMVVGAHRAAVRFRLEYY
ncbi:fimbrial protein [Pseudomonas sp. NPDC096917]|uniref:fimbrial protein n=1 Tax=Pseudomonas sp. NPDC096917 TaxID=3364483 RepID=UPI00383BD672